MSENYWARRFNFLWISGFCKITYIIFDGPVLLFLSKRALIHGDIYRFFVSWLNGIIFYLIWKASCQTEKKPWHKSFLRNTIFVELVLTAICLGWHFVSRNVQHQPRPLPANKYSKPSQEWNNSALLGKNISNSWFQLTNNLFFQKIMGILKKCKGAECNNVWTRVLFIQKY